MTEALRDRVVEALRSLNVWYDDPNGPSGYECQLCYRRSTNGSSPPPHDDDCEAMMLIDELNKLYEME